MSGAPEISYTLVRKKYKMTFQTLFLEALDILLEKRGLPSVKRLSSGEKNLICDTANI